MSHFSCHETEQKFCHEGLCELAENSTLNLPTHTPRLVDVIGQISAAVAEGDEIASEGTCHRLAQILGVMQQGDGPLVQQAYAGLSLEAQRGISFLMAN